MEVQIAEDGEILTRGPHVMQGYWQDPAATNEILIDGWLHTGDLGRIDADGFLYITGRKKELIVTAAGKNVAPVLLESLLTEDPLIEQALVIGRWTQLPDRADCPQLGRRPPRTAELEPINLAKPTCESTTRSQALFQRQIEYRLSRVSYHEQVRRFTLLARPFSL